MSGRFLFGKVQDMFGILGPTASSIVAGHPSLNFHTPIVNLVTKGLHGQDGKGFFELCANFFNAKQHGGNDHNGGNHGQVIPGFAKGIVQAQGQEQQPSGQEAGQMTGIKEWHGTGQDAFGTAQIVFKNGNGLMDFMFAHIMHGQFFNGKTQILNGAIGSMSGADNFLGLLGR